MTSRRAEVWRQARGLALVWTALGCAPDRVTAPEAPSPRLTQPADAIPADLDVVFRAELETMEGVVGPHAVDLLERGTRRPAGGTGGALREALRRATTAWVGFRPGLPPELTDNVAVLRGRFGGFDPRAHSDQPSWQPREDLGGGWWRYGRKQPERRSAPARLYLRPDDLVIAVSAAEIDSAERVLEQGIQDHRLRPPDQGDLSVAVRVPPVRTLLGDLLPGATSMLEGASELRASLTLASVGLKAEVEVDYAHHEPARRATDDLGRLLHRIGAAGGRWALVARAAKVQAVGSMLVLSIDLGAEVLGELLRCVEGAEGCGPTRDP
jgi:hypothetical protein